MAAGTPFGTLFRIESGAEKSLASPPSALRRDEYAGARAPSAYELERLNPSRWDSVETPGPSVPQTPLGVQTPIYHDDEDLEMSRPSSPHTHGVAEITPSLNNPPRNRWRFAACCTFFFANGFNDASIGALIPYMEKQYDIPYGVVSTIFVANALGFILAATYTNKLEEKLGRSRHMMLAASLMVVGYSIMVATPTFGLFCAAFFLTGTGMAIGMPGTNVFICNLTNSTTLLGLLHGVYGFGGVCGPLIATALASSGVHWSRFFAICIAISAINVVFNGWANIGFGKDKPTPLLAAVERSRRQPSLQTSSQTGSQMGSQTPEGVLSPRPLASGTQTPLPRPRILSAQASWRRTLSRTTVLGALFIFTYQGGEVSISGWVLSFLLAYRAPPYETSSPPTGTSGYNPLDTGDSFSTGSLGYVTSGFWGGLTLARMLATDKLAKLFGEIWAIVILMVSAAGFQLLVWLVPNLIAESVAIAVLGFLLGPIYPLATVVFARYLDRKVQVSSLAAIAALGSSGGAVMPFLIGIIAQGAGVWVLHPICLGSYAAMGVCWYGVNRGRSKRRE